MRESRVNALLTRVSDAKGQRKVRIQGVEEFVNGFAQKVDAFCVVAQSHDWKQVTRIKLAQFDEVIIGLVQLAAINNSCICIRES